MKVLANINIKQNDSFFIGLPVAAKSPSPIKQCSYLVKEISDAYNNTILLCGEEDFAATRASHDFTGHQ